MKTAYSRQADARTTRPASLAGMIFIFVLFAAAFTAPFLFASAGKKDSKRKAAESSKALKGLPTEELGENEAILQALNRLGFGPRPGDLERVKEIGLQKWIDRQLHPNSIDDSALETRLERFPTLKMSSAKLLEEFPEPQLAARRQGITVEEYRKEQMEQMRSATLGDAQSDPHTGATGGSAQNDMQIADALHMPNFEAMDNDLNPNPAKGKGQGAFSNRMINYEQIRLPQRIVAELSMAKMTRAVSGERQLQEMMVDFWYNHFNVFAAKGADRWLITQYEREAIRPYALGKFRDLLGATAKSPAMLFYLDNWLSADPVAWQKLQQQQQERRQMRGGPFEGGPFGRARFPQAVPAPNGNPNDPNAIAKQKQERGLNENYGRELMELHTLGVDGGYTQDDVINVAKAFTGWSIRQPRRDPEFFFEERLHDPGVKTVLGHEIHEGGMKDGEKVLDILARDPHTARHISFELAQRFVSDTPPDALVNRMAQTFSKTDGDIREVLHTMIYSPEFWSKEAFRSKIKTPFEVVASAARAVGADVQIPLLLVQWTGRIGQPLYQCEPPTGYSDKADAWVNTGTLLSRMNFSLALASNRVRGAQVDIDSLFGGDVASNPHAALDRAIQLLLGGQASRETRDTLENQLDDPQIMQAALDDKVKKVNTAMIAGLVLGSPEFQRR